MVFPCMTSCRFPCVLQVGRGQGFRAKCKAIKGTGRQHAKWSPVALCVFRQEPVIELNKTCLEGMSASEKQEYVASFHVAAKLQHLPLLL